MKIQCKECGELTTKIQDHITANHGNMIDYCIKHFTYISANNHDEYLKLYQLGECTILANHKNCTYRLVRTKPKKTWTCKHCNEQISVATRTGIGTHLNSDKCGFKQSIVEYAYQYYTEIEPEKFNPDERCAFCERPAINIRVDVDEVNETFRRYHINYFCFNDDCKRETFKRIWPNRTFTYELWNKIGSTKEYISAVNRISIDDAKHKKVPRDFTEWYKTGGKTCSLADFILRHGEELGTEKYKERGRKIGKSNSLEYYKERYGSEIGSSRWFKNIENAKRKTHGNTTSVQCTQLLDRISKYYNIVRESGIICEKRITVDSLIIDHNIIVEYFGDYWHCNPEVWSADTYNKTLKCTASFKWAKDTTRLDTILYTSPIEYRVLVIWEKTANRLTDIEICNYIEKLKTGEERLIII
jgi:hypothetical protein